MRTLLIIILVFFLFSCSSSVKSVQLDESMTRLLRSEIKIYDQSELTMSQFRIIEPVQAIACKSKPWDPAASEENALDQLRYKAYLKGANALFKVFCEPKEGINIQTDCLNSVTCYGVAIKIMRKL
jgi:hypothetical protein